MPKSRDTTYSGHRNSGSQDLCHMVPLSLCTWVTHWPLCLPPQPHLPHSKPPLRAMTTAPFQGLSPLPVRPQALFWICPSFLICLLHKTNLFCRSFALGVESTHFPTSSQGQLHLGQYHWFPLGAEWKPGCSTPIPKTPPWPEPQASIQYPEFSRMRGRLRGPLTSSVSAAAPGKQGSHLLFLSPQNG